MWDCGYIKVGNNRQGVNKNVLSVPAFLLLPVFSYTSYVSTRC